MSNTIIEITVEDAQHKTRLDKALAQHLPDMSRSRLQALIAQGALTCNNKPVSDSATKVNSGDTYRLEIPEIIESHIEPQKMDLDIIHEDADLLIINKPVGLTVHPAPGNRDGTLVNGLLAHCGDTLSGIGGVARPGIVHRLDKDTSGLMVVAKHDAAHAFLSQQLSSRTLKRTYQAVIWGGLPKTRGTITGNIGRSKTNRQKMAVLTEGGKEATTHYRQIETFHPGYLTTPFATHVECKLETGRTHQIRVHMMHIGNPLIGDGTYGQTTNARLKQNIHKKLPQDTHATLMKFDRQALHAAGLGLIHPRSQEAVSFTCPLPDDMIALLAALHNV